MREIGCLEEPKSTIPRPFADNFRSVTGVDFDYDRISKSLPFASRALAKHLNHSTCMPSYSIALSR